jgi:hypothetical protein
MSGKEAVWQIGQLCPGLVVLFMTGYAEDFIALNEIVKDGMVILQKPLRAEDLLRRLRKSLHGLGDSRKMAEASIEAADITRPRRSEAESSLVFYPEPSVKDTLEVFGGNGILQPVGISACGLPRRKALPRSPISLYSLPREQR